MASIEYRLLVLQGGKFVRRTVSQSVGGLRRRERSHDGRRPQLLRLQRAGRATTALYIKLWSNAATATTTSSQLRRLRRRRLAQSRLVRRSLAVELRSRQNVVVQFSVESISDHGDHWCGRYRLEPVSTATAVAEPYEQRTNWTV